ncbi:MAG: hypothetical protein JO171_09430 [Paludibacterium sp.]|uniref:hypothetical protein n=1 Tax=Paludibacterium sp. TaxID=1917523 RepID=UPI0025D62970|nr:hypothetical protein [Paludibacterium sp.]MBV8047363.1 hypothetical protein [Paludibacterium sp.]MBV8646286.1 hypothetical protein [Paludibacterium sp.]
MKKQLALGVIALLTCVSLTAMAEDTSAPVPIHRTTAKHRVVKQPMAKPSMATSKPAASSAH